MLGGTGSAVRLIDRVVNEARSLEATDDCGNVHRLPGVGGNADAIRECALRYILDEAASRECIDLVLEPNDDLFAPDNELLRLPAGDFWVEWFGMESLERHPKVGVLVQASPDGLSGSIRGYWEDELGRPETIGMCIYFDLSDRSLDRNTRPDRFTLRHGAYSHLDRLFRRAYVDVDPGWSAYLRTKPGPYNRTLSAIANRSWYYLPLTCAFAAMLNSHGLLDQHPSRLERLNAARARRGRAALLDHIEVRLNLDHGPRWTARCANQPGRNSPRLHYVRGHFVQRGGKTFWRSSHLRGDAGKPIIRKTVTVTRDRRRHPGNASAGANHDQIALRIAK